MPDERTTVGSNKPGPTSWVLADRDVENLLEQVIASQEVVIDLETTGLIEHATTGGSLNGGVAGRVALAALTLPMPDESGEWDGIEPTTYIWPLSHRDSPFLGTWRPQLTRLCQVILEHEKPLNNQNMKFDARWLYAMTGVDLSHLIVWDTEVSSSLLDETRSRKLKERAPETFDVPRWDDDMDFTKPGAAERADLMLLGEYGARDTYWTWRLAQNHREQMYLIPSQEPPYSGDDVRHARLGQIATWVSMPTVASMTAVEQRGFMLDTEWTKQRLDEEETTARDLLADMASRFNIEGTPSTAPTSHWFGAWTQAAVDEDQLRVIEITPNGKPSWSKRSLRKQAAQGNELAQLVLDQRGATKRAEYLRSWLGRQVAAGSIHAKYNIGSVATGRLSSSEPNMQQVTSSLKPAFIPRPGYLIAELDYCLEGSMRVLTSDLRWVAADQLKVGEKVIGFPEKVGKGAGRTHTYEEAEVTSLRTIRRPSVILIMEDGRQLRCSAEHRWLSFGQGKGHPRRWVEAQHLQPGDIIPTLTEPWEEPDPVDAAYLRGFLDGEGWVSQTVTGWGQLPGAVRDEVVAASERLGISWRQSNHLNSGVEQHIVTTMSESLRILGMIRPHRLLPKARQVWEGRQTYGKYNTGARVAQVIPAGEQNVIAVGTSTKTMVVEGFLSHNSQIELRVAAFISRSQPMIEAYQRGDDLHRIIAANTVNMRLKAEGAPLITPADVTGEQRQGGKASNFGLLYGQEPYGFRLYAEDVYGVVMTEHEAVQAHTAFFDTWTGLREWHLDVMRRVRRDGYIVSPLGRIRRLPGIWDGYDKTVRHAENAAINSPVQGMASDMMQMSIASILGYLPGSQKVSGAHPIATVHDSIVLEVRESDWQSIVEEAKERMQTVDRYLSKLDVDFDVPLQADATVGTRWGLGDVHAD